MADKYDGGDITESGIDSLTKLPDKSTMRNHLNNVFNEGIIKLEEGDGCLH